MSMVQVMHGGHVLNFACLLSWFSTGFINSLLPVFAVDLYQSMQEKLGELSCDVDCLGCSRAVQWGFSHLVWYCTAICGPSQNGLDAETDRICCTQF